MRKVKGAVLISIIASTILAVIVQASLHIVTPTRTRPASQTNLLAGSLIAVPVFGHRQGCDFFGGFGVKLGRLP